MDTVVIGVGNPILTDDGVGIHAARELRSHLAAVPGVEVTELAAGGLRLMERMVGYRRAIILDALVTGEREPGTVVELGLQDLPAARNLSCAHDTDLSSAMELGRTLGVPLPQEVRIFGIEAQDVETFGDVLSEPVAAAVPTLVDRVLGSLSGSAGGCGENRGLLL